MQKLAAKATPAEKPATPVITLPAEVRGLVEYLYADATTALTSTVNASITANGIETPLGVLTVGQIEKGQAVLDDLSIALGVKTPSAPKLESLSGDFYTLIPHRFGRSREAAQEAVIDSAAKLTLKLDTLQLMRDMLSVNGDGNVLLTPEVERKYLALNCCIQPVPAGVFADLKQFVEKSVVRQGTRHTVKGVWQVGRAGEADRFAGDVGNVRRLFHGSAVKNWVGILSRGLLLPKAVTALGVRRTDAGWLGHGLYFGDAICTSAGYAHPGSRKTRFVAVASVALGKPMQYRKITWGLNAPPEGYHSCHGVRGSAFADDEYVVYDARQQRLDYLVELAA